MSEQDAVEQMEPNEVLEMSKRKRTQAIERYGDFEGRKTWAIHWASHLQQALQAQRKENERLREFLNDIGYPDTAINVILDAAEVVDALEEQEAQGGT